MVCIEVLREYFLDLQCPKCKRVYKDVKTEVWLDDQLGELEFPDKVLCDHCVKCTSEGNIINDQECTLIPIF